MNINTIQQIRQKSPLVLFLTNSVTENLCANTLLAFGGSPIMSHASQELHDLLAMADALVINLGTLNNAFIEYCSQAIAIANQHNLAIVIDPVGAGASKYRTESSNYLLSQAKKVTLKSNASELMALAGLESNTKGVDSTHQSDIAISVAEQLINKPNIENIVITGKIDYVISEDLYLNQHGHSLMTKVTGMGCALNGCLAAALALGSKANYLLDVICFYGLAGEKAAAKARGPASFQTLFLDELSQ